MDKMFGLQKEEALKKSASDEMYLQGLKSKIQENVKKTKKNFKNNKYKIKTNLVLNRYNLCII